MKRNNAPPESIKHAVETQNSGEPEDVRFHREYIKKYNKDDQWKDVNNFVLHPTSYRFGSGGSSRESIGEMLSTLGHPIYMGPSATDYGPHIQPYVYFGQNQHHNQYIRQPYNQNQYHQNQYHHQQQQQMYNMGFYNQPWMHIHRFNVSGAFISFLYFVFVVFSAKTTSCFIVDTNIANLTKKVICTIQPVSIDQFH
ncbi:hypothetical protein PPL_04611 [Heterostelium album PN500]|uniref:Uncharacterized protein n=1 Tax=Heterostelium pallidum (strain ATCC 26659 / Pp 5 / PN500) TaxID=670386 RepID=D3B821_HETP5|nr:hypothetical protein PPL_04611 [Heterostelium album PN500]EFA82189.1 hypothetical protein PPL_04611 [Heterostelium album PN500]|eukprot:XP_020434306.1 hypothetical protein PPL_04611 [Heterostelium album PN500]